MIRAEKFLPPGQVPSIARQGKVDYFVEINSNNVVVLNPGDYIIHDGVRMIRIVSEDEYRTDKLEKLYVDRVIGQQIADTILANHQGADTAEDSTFIAALGSIEKSLQSGKFDLAKELINAVVDTKIISVQIKADVIAKIDQAVTAATAIAEPKP